MASRSVTACGLLVLIVVASPASPSPEQPAAKVGGAPPPWRVIVGPSLFRPDFETTYVSTYAPPFEYVPHTSTATQTLPLPRPEHPPLTP